MLQTRKIEVLNWSSAKPLVKAVNQELYDIIEAIKPGENLKLVRATYLYGDLIAHNGITQIPTKDGKLATVDNSDLPKEIKRKLSYHTIPLFVTLKNDNEVFLDTGRRIVPLNLFHQGSLVGIFEALSYIFKQESHPKWCVSSGARSMILLPKMADNLGLDRLRVRYNIPAQVYPAEFQNQWECLKIIAQHPHFEQPWENEVLFFTQDWLGNTGCKWQRFNDCIYKQGWEHARFSLGRIESNLQWETFAEAMSLRNLKPRPYLADQLKHILAIIDRKSPAFRPVCDQTFAPLSGLKKAIVEIYGLKHYLPTIMCVNPLHSRYGSPVYYSLSFPTLLEGTSIDHCTSTVMLDVRKLKFLIDTIQTHGRSDYHELVQQIEYFHIEHDKFNEIKRSNEITRTDDRFLEDLKQFPKRKFCSSSIFWRGCVRIKIN